MVACALHRCTEGPSRDESDVAGPRQLLVFVAVATRLQLRVILLRKPDGSRQSDDASRSPYIGRQRQADDGQ